MLIEFDPAKDDRNIAKRGLSFERAAEFDFETAAYIIDDRRNYGETRYIAVGVLDSRLHVLCYTLIAGGFRVISFRKAYVREARRYGNNS